MNNLLPPPKPLLLIVDDTPSNLALMSGLLKDSYKIKVATNGENALRIAVTVPQPSLILLDIMMPGMDGYEVCEKLKADNRTCEIPVIFLTAKVEEKDEQRGFAVGAVDYITKPVSGPIVKARIHTHLALHDARVKLEKQNQVLLCEQELVENIITRMRASKSFDDRYLRYLLASVERTNGDILLSAFSPDGRQRILVGDFTGHGLPAAVGAPLIAHMFYAHARHGVTIEVVLEEINTILYEQLPTNVFMTGCLVELDRLRQRIKIWNAGMPQCLFMHQGTVHRRINSQNLPLGIVEQFDAMVGCESFEVFPESCLYIFSDGLTEVSSPAGELFGCARVEQSIARLLAENAQPEALLAHLQDFHGNGSFSDDITLVEIQV
ncbi:two-component system, HptB-dependent secretion and biofilm response regulator [Gammaproteobacteria bacterium]